jgi:hypothetical protein
MVTIWVFIATLGPSSDHQPHHTRWTGQLHLKRFSLFLLS